jgi:hypothetical protein
VFQTFYRYVKLPGTETEIGLVQERVMEAARSGEDPAITFRGTLWPWDYAANRRASYGEAGEIKSDYLTTPDEAERFVVRAYFVRRVADRYNALRSSAEEFHKWTDTLFPYDSHLEIIREANILRSLISDTGRSILRLEGPEDAKTAAV